MYRENNPVFDNGVILCGSYETFPLKAIVCSGQFHTVQDMQPFLSVMGGADRCEKSDILQYADILVLDLAVDEIEVHLYEAEASSEGGIDSTRFVEERVLSVAEPVA
jgi:hypothetical protein